MYRKIDGVRIFKLLLNSILLVLGGMFVPVLFAFIPPMFLSEMRQQGVLPISAAFVGACILVGVLTDPVMGLSILTVMGPMILFLDYSMRADKSVEKTMVFATILFLVGMGFVLYRTGTLASIQSGEMSRNIVDLQAQVMKSAHLTAMEQSRIGANLKTVTDRAFMLLPSLCFLSALGVVYASYRISGRNMRMTGEKVVCPGPFYKMRLPRNGVIASLAIVGAAFAAEGLFSLDIQVYAVNGAMILVSLLAFQGLSIVNYFLLHHVRSPFLRVVIMFFAMTVPVGQMGLAALGLIDQFIDIRSIQGA